MTGFVDEAQLNVRGGDGGAGCVSFRREGPEVRGGPNGGDGGDGGDVWLVADRNVASLLAFRDHPHRRAGSGVHGKGKDQHGASRQGPRDHRARGHRRARPLHRRGPRRPGAPRRPLAGGRRRPGRAGQRQVPLQPPAGPQLRRAGRARRGALAQAGAEADGRRRPRRLPQRRQEHVHQPHLGRQAEDRRLPVHHARAAPRRRAPRRRHRVRGRRHPRPDRGGQRGPGPRPPVPPPHRAGPGAVRPGRPRPGRRHDARRAGGDPAARARRLPARAARAARASSSAPRPTSPSSPWDGPRISAVTGEGVAELVRRPRPTSCARPAPRRPRPTRRSSSTGRCPRASPSSGSASGEFRVHGRAARAGRRAVRRHQPRGRSPTSTTA